MKKRLRKGLLVYMLGLCLAASIGIAVGVSTTANAVTSAATVLWRTTDSASTIANNVSTPSYAENGAGVEVVSRSAGSEVEFINPIDVSGKTEIIRLMATPSYRGALDFANLTVWLTDADDDSVFMKIQLLVNPWWAWGTYTNVTTNTTTQLGYGWGSETDTEQFSTYGFEGTFISFHGITGGEDGAQNAHKPFSIWYDSDTLTVSVRTHSGAESKVLRLDHSDAVGYGNEWGGFTRNRVKLSVSANDLRAAEARYLILAVGGQSMAGETVTDTLAPSLKVQFDALPDAQVGRAWRVPAADAVDAVDGTLPVKVEYKTPLGADYTEIVGDSFTPTEQGIFSIRYSSVDLSGNSVEKVLTLNVRGGVPAPTVTFDTVVDTDVTVGERVYIPTFTATGGSGTLQTEIELTRVADGKVYDVSNGYFIPNVSGQYLLTVTATGWLGNVGRSMLVYTAQYVDGPILDGELSMYPFFIDGLKVELPTLKAYDVGVIAGGRVRAAVTVTATGTGDKSNVSRKLDGMLFTPTKAEFGDAVKLTYVATASDGKKTTVEKTVGIHDKATQLGDYFAFDNMSIAYSKDNVVLSTDAGDGAATFTVPLNAYNTVLQIRPVTEKRNYEKVYVELVDSADANIAVRLYLVERQGLDNTFVYYNGTQYSMRGTLAGNLAAGVTSTELQFNYDDATRTFTDRYGKKILTVDRLADGRPFEGFPSTTVRVKVGFEGVTAGGAAIVAEKICNQFLYADYDYDDSTQIVDFVDYVPPYIRFDQTLEIAGALGTYATLPAVRAFDELTPYMDVTVSVTSPSGQTVLSAADATVSNRFLIAEQGKYEIVYATRDARGNRLNSGWTVSSEDNVAPTVLVKERNLIAPVGMTFDVPRAIVQDDLTENPELHIYVYNGHSEVVELVDGKFTATTAGKYIIRYVAFDDADNCTMVDVSLTVA